MPRQSALHDPARRHEIRAFAESLLRNRRNRGMSQEDLARHLGVTPAYISHIEIGLRIPSDLVCLRLGKALGLDPRDLVITAHQLRTSADAAKFLDDLRDPLAQTLKPFEGAPNLQRVLRFCLLLRRPYGEQLLRLFVGEVERYGRAAKLAQAILTAAARVHDGSI